MRHVLAGRVRSTKSVMESMRNKLTSTTKIRVLAVFASIFFCTSQVALWGQDAATISDLDNGIKLLNAQKFDDAIEVLKKFTKTSKGDAEGWYYLGTAYLFKGDFKKGTACLETAISLRSNFAEAHTALSYALLRTGKLIPARLQAEKALSIKPDDSDAHYTLGIISFRRGSRIEAVDHARKAVKGKPDFAEAYLLKAQALVAFSGTAIDLAGDDANPNSSTYLEAAEALKKYVTLVPESERRRVWQEQAEVLELYAKDTGSSEVFGGRDVTTKAKLISKPEPQYTEEARRSMVTGRVVLKTVFASDGQVKHILVVRAVPNGLTEAAIRAAKRIRFVPATKDGKPVSMWMTLEYNFSLY